LQGRTKTVIGRFIRKNRGEMENGQNMVEFALIVPFFLLLVFAIVDFGMGFHAWITVTNSAREGARLGAVGGDAAAIEAVVRDRASSLNDEQLTVTVTNAEGDPGDSVIVQAEYEYELITPLSSIMGLVSGSTLGPTLEFESTSEMRLE
jgi:Flp pilus assembly protein TadG